MSIFTAFSEWANEYMDVQDFPTHRTVQMLVGTTIIQMLSKLNVKV